MIGLTSGTAEAIPAPVVSANAKPQDPATSFVIIRILVFLPISQPDYADDIQRNAECRR
jgi:hypothetical protein